MLSHNNIYQNLQTIDNHVELIILRRWENFLKGAVKKNKKYPNLWPSPSFFFLSFDAMIGPLLFDQDEPVDTRVYTAVYTLFDEYDSI